MRLFIVLKQDKHVPKHSESGFQTINARSIVTMRDGGWRYMHVCIGWGTVVLLLVFLDLETKETSAINLLIINP